MNIGISNEQGYASFKPDDFAKFRNFVLTGQKIQAIKLLRELDPLWGLKAAKDFVESCYFGCGAPDASATCNTQDHSTDFNNFLYELKDDLRTMLLIKEENRASYIVELFARVCTTLAKR